MAQQAKDPQADDIETAQDEEAIADKEQDSFEKEERSTVDEVVSLASAPPAELGLIKAAKKAAAAEAPAKKVPAELGLVPPKPAEKEAPAKADNEKDAKPIPAELGFIPKKAPAADSGDKGEKADGGDKGDGNNGLGYPWSGKSLTPDWPIDNFPSGVYAPDGVPYPL